MLLQIIETDIIVRCTEGNEMSSSWHIITSDEMRKLLKQVVNDKVFLSEFREAYFCKLMFSQEDP